MPSVGMRRSTRVFGTRVLRSGRRLWSEPHEGGKHVRAAHGENKFQGLLDNSADGGGGIDDRHEELWQEDEKSASVDMTAEHKMEECERDGVDEKNMDRKCRIVYTRKRKRAELTTAAGLTEDGRYAKKYRRGEWRTRCRAIESFGARGLILDSDRTRELAIVVNESSYDCYYWITCFLTSLLSYMTRVRIGMRQLSAFMLSKPIFDAYSSSGILFLQDHITAKKPCVCIVSGFGSAMPLCSVNISAIPPLFVHIQTSMYLRSALLDCLLVGNCENDEELLGDDAREPSLQIPSGGDQQDCACEASEISAGRELSYNNVVASNNDISVGRHSPVVGFPKSALRSLQLRNSRNIQKRRSSFRRKRGRPPSALRAQKAKGALASELLRTRYDGSQSSAASSSRLLISPDKRRPTTNIKELKSATGVAMTQDGCASSSCSANLLITDTDKCYRVEGATIALEVSASNQWLLSVTKGGTKQCSLIAQKVMRPSSFNRFTHAVIWSGDGCLKFEFPDKQDWMIFKELYKECSDRNIPSPAASVIPVPGVQEVSSPVDQYLPFVRPESYITLKDDELKRALKKTGNYDMDSDDEEWLAKLNSELNAGRELQEFITPENFEFVIDALEKGLHCFPRKHLDKEAAYDCCMHLEGKEAIEAIYKYWIRKRKQKKSALVKVFQLYQPTRSQVVPNFVFRKKRSFKRKASLYWRGKQRHLFKAIAAEGAGLGPKNSVNDLQEAKDAAGKYEGLATLKRQRAQMLMENADLATYKATMAVRIAEAAAQVEEAPERVASFFLG
ncbi:hypothetical protein C2S51_033095 [Perilla frutescens var. frutescens]|nr:hypothetical protein C2S51_033095 [Perilla frutescens var. frutescens]